MPGRARRPDVQGEDRASLRYGSSRACNASSVGSPADSRSPVALRVPARARIAVSWCGRFPAGGERFDIEVLGLVELSPGGLPSRDSWTSRSSFGNPADSESPVALRHPARAGVAISCSRLSVPFNLRAAPCGLSPQKSLDETHSRRSARRHVRAAPPRMTRQGLTPLRIAGPRVIIFSYQWLRFRLSAISAGWVHGVGS